MAEIGTTAIVIAISSDIGDALARRFLERGYRVFGTYRTYSNRLAALEQQGVRLVKCDLADPAAIARASAELRDACPVWDILVLCPGWQEPVGPFRTCAFDTWAESINVNFINQARFVRELLAKCRSGGVRSSCVLFFAGGGTNNATVNYSAYTVSKIALIKLCELLDAEMPDVRFAIVGPGWVRTKIHEETLRAGLRAGENLQRTQEKLARNDFVPMDEVIACCEWVFRSPREVVGGRNFSVVFDPWDTRELEAGLAADSNLYKLRRHGNEMFNRHN